MPPQQPRAEHSDYKIWESYSNVSMSRESKTLNKLACGPMPNVMAALPNIGRTLCSTPQSLADAQYCSAVQYRCKDAKPVEISWAAPNYRTDLSR